MNLTPISVDVADERSKHMPPKFERQLDSFIECDLEWMREVERANDAEEDSIDE